MITVRYKNTGRYITISENAHLFEKIFNKDTDGCEFLNQVTSQLNDFERLRGHPEYTTYLNDVYHIVQCTMNSLNLTGYSRLFRNRVNAYFYICNRVGDYYQNIKQMNNNDLELRSDISLLRNQLLEKLGSAFKSAQGTEPNLDTNDLKLPEYLNIRDYLSFIKNINHQSIHTVFALCKLLLQSLSIDSQPNNLEWKNILFDKEFTISFKDFMSYYIEYKNVLPNFPMDTKTFIYLIETISPPKNGNPFDLKHCFSRVKEFGLEPDNFFENFLNIFSDGVKNLCYSSNQIAELLWIMSKTNSTLFNQYLSQYYANLPGSKNDILTVFFDFSEKYEINENIQKRFTHYLEQYIQKFNMKEFLDFSKTIKEHSKNIEGNNFAYCMVIIEALFEYFIKDFQKRVDSTTTMSGITWNDVLQSSLEVLPTRTLSQTSNLLIFKRLLLEYDNPKDSVDYRIGALFTSLKKCDQQLYEKNVPADIIFDNLLQHVLIDIPQEFCTQFKHHTYRNLCNTYQNNPWTCFVWTRITYLSIVKSIGKNSYMLSEINKWMVDVKHSTFAAEDKLTIIFIYNLFELVIKHVNPILSLPNIPCIINFIYYMRDAQLDRINTQEINNFIERAQQEIQAIIQLKGKRSIYEKKLTLSNIDSILQTMDLEQMLTYIQSSPWNFPKLTLSIESILPSPKLTEMDINKIDSNKEICFNTCIEIGHAWILWFLKFFNIFEYPLEWFKNHQIGGALELFIELNAKKKEPTVTLLEMKETVEKIVTFLKPLEELPRLCYLFKCLIPFKIVEKGTINSKEKRTDFIKYLKDLHRRNQFQIGAKRGRGYPIAINSRQHVRWSLTSEQFKCDVKVEYSTSDNDFYELFNEQTVSLDRTILNGEFETQKAGSLLFTIENEYGNVSERIWFRIKSTDLSKCYLFNGIFDLFHQPYVQQFAHVINEHQLNSLLNETFLFIDNLLAGTITLKDMNKLETTFYNKNIIVQDEVRSLCINQSNANKLKQGNETKYPTDDEIQQVCERIQIYQYYSHINSIIKCIEKFDILPEKSDNELIDNLKRLLNDEKSHLSEISDVYKILKKELKCLLSSHLLLIKTVNEYSAVIKMMKSIDLYSNDGRHRFHELRNNLTMQFQLQERNNTILNSLIITHVLCEPFVIKANSFTEFVNRVSQLENIDDSSLKDIKVINENIQVVNMWLSAEATAVLDNALIIMEHLYKTGIVIVHLNRLINEESCFEIEYSIEQMHPQLIRTSSEENQDGIEKQQQEIENIKFNLSMAGIDDHKRQLTFCNIDLQQDMIHTKLLLHEQLKVLEIIENIYLILVKLEISGHPNYQYKEKTYTMFDKDVNISAILTELKNDPIISEHQLENIIQKKIKGLELDYTLLKYKYDLWLIALEQSRQKCHLLKLFTNRQIMIMIILLTTPAKQHKIKRYLLEKLCLSANIDYCEEDEIKLTVQCLAHYLRSLRLNNCNLSNENLSRLCMLYKIESIEDDSEFLKKLRQFLQELFTDAKELFSNDGILLDNQQYLVTLDSTQEGMNITQLGHDLDMKTCCVLLNIFNNRLPNFYQILWCSSATKDDIELFFSRVRTFHNLTFAVLDIDKMHHQLRVQLLNEQRLLIQQQEHHGSIYYFTQEIKTYQKDIRSFPMTKEYQDPKETYTQLVELFKNDNNKQPDIQIICGKPGVGKTHRIRNHCKKDNTLCFSINDKLNLNLLTSSLLSYDSMTSNTNPSIYFNISIHAPFEDLTRTLFSLLICGSLVDPYSGLTFSLLSTKSWKFIFEIPHTNKYQMSIQDNLAQILPILSLMAPSAIEEITDTNYQLYIGEEEEKVARFLKAYADQSIDRVALYKSDDSVDPVHFDQLDDKNECRMHINDCLANHAPELSKDKVSQISFVKFLHRRCQFFTSPFYQLNDNHLSLGSSVMKQMIIEAKSLAKIDFQTSNYPRIFLVFDPGFALHLLHDDWLKVPSELREIFNNSDPMCSDDYKDKDWYIESLSWLINIKYEQFEQTMRETKFILTENFAYKLFHIHERKLTRLPLIIEGETGVGKTFLLKFYSLLLNFKVTKGQFEDNVAPRILERTSLWLLKTVLNGVLERETHILKEFLKQIKPKLVQRGKINADDYTDDIDNDEQEAVLNNPLHSTYSLERTVDTTSRVSLDGDENFENDDMVNDQNIEQNLTIQEPNVQHLLTKATAEKKLLKKVKHSLQTFEYDKNILQLIWKIILTASSQSSTNITQKLIQELYEYVRLNLRSFPLIEISLRLKELLEKTNSSNEETAIEIFNNYLVYTQTKPLFYRLLLHPGITEKQLEQFLLPISELASQLPNIELVVFFDEINTSSCLGLFKEIFIDRTLYGVDLPKNIFFTGAINPAVQVENNIDQVHRTDYLVHHLPEPLDNLKVSYGILESKILSDYITKKIATFLIDSGTNNGKKIPLAKYPQDILSRSIIRAQEFCEKRLGRNSVSQREIQQCFNLIDFFWSMRYDSDLNDEYHQSQIKLLRCIALSLALIYYFRLPTKEDNIQRNDSKTPSREDLDQILSQIFPNFSSMITEELDKFVNTDNFVIPEGVAINRAIREHIFGIVVSIVTRTPICIIGAPGQSKTLSFQIVLQNLQGSQLSTKPFCKRLPAIDPFFCLGSKYTRSEDIAYAFECAIKREQNYQKNRVKTQCVVFLDEASLPDESKMILKVLHPYLDECKVAFVAIANKAFDAANANRMICIYRSLPSKDDQKILAYGCLGLDIKNKKNTINNRLQNIILGLCQGYRNVFKSPDIPNIFHDRDFIYMLRELRFELKTSSDDENLRATGIIPSSLLHSLEDNFNGITKVEFEKLIEIFFTAVQEKCPDFELPSKKVLGYYRNIPTILRNSIVLDPSRRRLYGRYKLIIDESEDESAIRLLFQTGILDSNPNKTSVFRMSDFQQDIDNELRNVEILSTIKLCMETGKTILMINTGRIHGALYDVFNQNFSIMATGDTRKIFSKVAIGPKTVDVVIHEDFQCIVHIKRSEFKDIPAPFLSRFQKYSFSISDFFRIEYESLSEREQIIMKDVEEKAQTFIQHFGRQYFCGFNDDTLYSYLLSLIKIDENQQRSLVNIQHHYTQLTIKSKPFIEQNLANIRQCLLRSILSKLIQTASPESIIVKLPTFENKIARWIYKNYFQQQEHFNIENFIIRLLSSQSTYDDDNFFNVTTDLPSTNKSNNIMRTTKVIIYTRISHYIIGLNAQTKNQLFTTDDNFKHDPFSKRIDNISEQIDIFNMSTIDNAVDLQKIIQNYEQNNKTRVLIIIIDTRIKQQYLHIPLIRQMIDKSEQAYNSINQSSTKHFVLLVHSSAQELYHRSCFSTIFLYDWDFYYFDTCTRSNIFHLQKMIQMLSLNLDEVEEEYPDHLSDEWYDFNTLFDDCIWDFCSRIQISRPGLSRDTFNDSMIYEFYQRGISIMKRVQILKTFLQKYIPLQSYIINLYHDYLTSKKNSMHKIYNLIYQISKDILCGKRFDGFVDSIQYQLRIPFINFVSNILKLIVNDYGLETILNAKYNPPVLSTIFKLIDYSQFNIDDDSDILLSGIIQGTFQINMHSPFVPKTLMFNLFYQRIQAHIDEIKSTLIDKINESTDSNDKAIKDNVNFKIEPIEFTLELFRRKLTGSILNDVILSKIFSEYILLSYLYDLIQKTCSIIEKNFSNSYERNTNSVEFIVYWLLLTNVNDQKLPETCSNKYIWRLAHVLTSLEYESNDLLSIYSACRLVDYLEQTQMLANDENKESQLVNFIKSLKEHKLAHSDALRQLFKLMFNHLWKNLCAICLQNDKSQQWIYTYNFIFTYYPSSKILDMILTTLNEKAQIEFMHLAYLILLNEHTSEPEKLISHLLNQTKLINENNNEILDWYEILPKIIDSIQEYFENNDGDISTLIIDISQWIMSTLRILIAAETCRERIQFLLKYINQPTCRMSLRTKQFLFDELMNLSLEIESSDEVKQEFSCIDRIKILLPIIFECLTAEEINSNYQLPYHPSVVLLNDRATSRQTLLDLFFFHLKRHSSIETITCSHINEILLESVKPQIRNKDLKPIVDKYFKQLEEYCAIEWTALLLSDAQSKEKQSDIFPKIIQTIIEKYLSFDPQAVQFNSHLQLFLSIIISKQSWNYFLNLLQSDHLQTCNGKWANDLYNLLNIKQVSRHTQYLDQRHQISFTVSTNNSLSIFPKLHQSYDELSKIIDKCVEENLQDQKWKILFDWIETKQNTDLHDLTLVDIKVMILLKIYYDYYCNNKLTLLDTLLEFIKTKLEPLPEELIVFQALLQPEQFIIGYKDADKEKDPNCLNKLFKIDCNDEYELCIRHLLVNLMAMILMSGKKSFLWTFAFEPLTLQNTHGFGSTASEPIESDYVHYDCGCILSHNGDLQYFDDKDSAGPLNVPAIYVVFFSTFGALVWHLLLYDRAVDNLHGPILAEHAIADETADVRLVGDDIRTKVCHFVRARVLATFSFLSMCSNRNDACVLFNLCFEKFAFLTVNHQENEGSWIKPIYETVNDQHNAEKEYLEKVFYPMYRQLPEYKTCIDDLCLKTELQKNIQDFISQMPINIQFSHFKIELNDPKYLQLPLNILQRILNSPFSFKMTKYIHDLSKFYVLLHQTYAQLIEQDKFFEVTLQELYELGLKHYKNIQRTQLLNRNKSHLSIIDNGIKAINEYHNFTGGFIRPGACDETQKFMPIDMKAQVSYLVTTSNHDENDIVWRILSVLVDYHNELLDILEENVKRENNNGCIRIRSLINELTSKEISVLQIMDDNTGVITLNDRDYLYIENLCKASLISQDEYFPTINMSLTFDFFYVQSYIIRKYFLHRRINSRHISQKYQCYIRRMSDTISKTSDMEIFDLDKKYTISLSNQQLDTDWNHLKEMSSDKLYHGYSFFRQIILLLKNQENDRSEDNLYDFIQIIDNDSNLYEKLKEYEIKNFKLCYIDHVRKLYETSIKGFEHLFTTVSPILRIPINPELNIKFIEILQTKIINLDYKNNIDKINEIIKQISNLLNELTELKTTLLQKSNQSLTMICQYLLNSDNFIFKLIPDDIKCENYVSLYIHLNKVRSILQEQIININENQIKSLWNEEFSVISQSTTNQQENCFQKYLHTQNNVSTVDQQDRKNEELSWEFFNMGTECKDDTNTVKDSLLTTENSSYTQQYQATNMDNKNVDEIHVFNEIKYSTLFQLVIEVVSLKKSTFIQQIHEQRQKTEEIKSISLTKSSRFSITYADGKTIVHLWKETKLYEQLQKLFSEKKYDSKIFAVIDKDEILVNFMNNNIQLPSRIQFEYKIIEQIFLIQIQFYYQTKIFEYFVTSTANISTLINRFIYDNNLQFISSDIYLNFFDEFGKCINGETIADISNKNLIKIIVTEENVNNSTLCEITVYLKQGQQKTDLFHPMTTMQQIYDWLKIQTELIDLDFVFLENEQKTIVNNEQSISSLINSIVSTKFDGINRDDTIQITLSFDTHSQNISALKFISIYRLLLNKNLFQQLKVNTSIDNCIFILENSNEQLSKEDIIRKSLSEYLNENNNQSIRIRISILIQIIKNDDKQQLKVPISSQNTTIQQILQLINIPNHIYKYLASNITKYIHSNNEYISNLKEISFILAKENETCLISIKISNEPQLIEIDDENIQNQRYMTSATIFDVYQQNKIDMKHKFLLYSNDFVPSYDIQLNSFLITSPIQFTIIENNLDMNITIRNGEDLVKFNCSDTIKIERLLQISCQLFNIKTTYYKLMYSDCLIDGDEMTLVDIQSCGTENDLSMNDVELTLVSTGTLNVSITYLDQTMIFPCEKETQLLDILKETFAKLQISEDDIDNYQIISLDEERTHLENDTTMEDVLGLFSEDTTIIQLELKKKEN